MRIVSYTAPDVIVTSVIVQGVTNSPFVVPAAVFQVSNRMFQGKISDDGYVLPDPVAIYNQVPQYPTQFTLEAIPEGVEITLSNGQVGEVGKCYRHDGVVTPPGFYTLQKIPNLRPAWINKDVTV